ncbi:MAG: TolC family protein [Rectinemataceae bacterium]
MVLKLFPAAALALAASLAAGAEIQASASGSPAITPLPSSEAGSRTITLAELVSGVLSSSDELRIQEATLASARAQHALNLGKALPTLSGNAAYGDSYGFNDQSQAKSAGASGLGLGQTLSAGLNFAVGTATTTSGTRIGLTVSHALPVSPQKASSSGTTYVNAPQVTSVQTTLSQAVWDGYAGGQTRAAIDKSLLVLQGREFAARQSRATTIASAKQAYVTTLVAQRTLALRLDILGKQAFLQRQVEATFALKQASAVDLETARINSRSAELDVETGRHDFALARQRLAPLLGQPPDLDFRVAEIDVPELPAATLEEAIAKGLANRVDIAQYEVTRRSSAIDAALARASAQPTVTVTGGIGLSYNWGADAATGSLAAAAVTAANGEAINLGLRVAMPLLDGGAAKGQEDLAKASMLVASTQAGQLAKTIAADIRDAWWTFSILGQKAELARRSLGLAQTQMALVRQQLQFGTATTQDLLNASVNAANAEAAWLKARSDQLLGELTLETRMGL